MTNNLDTNDMNALIDNAVAKLIKNGANLQRINDAEWVSEIERKLTRSLPPSFRNLITRYSFATLDFEIAELFSNLGDNSAYDLTTRPFGDPHMSPWLVQHDFIYIGHPYIGNYDPVCFDMKNLSSTLEPKVVTLNHEDIILGRSQVRVTPLLNSFLELLNTPLNV